MSYIDPQLQIEGSSRKSVARHDRKAKRAPRSSAKASRPAVTPLNEVQADYLEALKESAQVFAIGPAGTGKTYLAARHAMRLLLAGAKEKVVISRSTVSKPKHRLGFRPGNQDEKVADWMVPIMDGFKAEAGVPTIDKMQKEGQIEFLAFETMRGRSLADTIAILDEAQNCDLGDLRLFLTRIGEGTQVIVCGDTTQVDISDSGLDTVLQMIEDQGLSAEIVEFSEDDVVRSAIAKEWVKAFSAV